MHKYFHLKNEQPLLAYHFVFKVYLRGKQNQICKRDLSKRNLHVLLSHWELFYLARDTKHTVDGDSNK